MHDKELYQLNTPFDLKEELSAYEKEILAALLSRLSELTENNDYQKEFMHSVNAYIEVSTPREGIDISCIDDIENIHSQKILMQTAMEYMYLASGEFSFLEELEEEVFGHFSVNRKGVREIKEYISAADQAVGREGIAGKYGSVAKEKKQEKRFLENDRIDIGMSCADRINTHQYVELDEYLVYLFDEERDYYKVHKRTGERTIVWRNEKQDNFTFCGMGNKIYLFVKGNTGILEINVDTGDERKIEFLYKKTDTFNKYPWSNSSVEIRPQCSKEFLVYNTKINGCETVAFVNLKTYYGSIIANSSKMPLEVDQFYLSGDKVYIIPRKEKYLYIYNLAEEKIEKTINVRDEFESHWDYIVWNMEERLLFRSRLEDNGTELAVSRMDLETIEQSNERKIFLDDYDGLEIFDSFGEWWAYGQFVFMVSKDENGAIWCYDIEKEHLSQIVEESFATEYYSTGVIFKESHVCLNISETQLIGDVFYYSTNEGEIYKISIQKKQSAAERL